MITLKTLKMTGFVIMVICSILTAISLNSKSTVTTGLAVFFFLFYLDILRVAFQIELGAILKKDR
jgi:hypothetical protein